MIRRPKVGMRVTLRYRKSARDKSEHFMNLYLKKGMIRKVANGKGPRNCLVSVEKPIGLMIIPRGHLFYE